MTKGVVNVAPEHIDTAWGMVEELTFARTSQVPVVSVTSLARKIGMTHPAVRAWEDGEYMPGLSAFVAWADVLGYEVVLRPRLDS